PRVVFIQHVPSPISETSKEKSVKSALNDFKLPSTTEKSIKTDNSSQPDKLDTKSEERAVSIKASKGTTAESKKVRTTSKSPDPGKEKKTKPKSTKPKLKVKGSKKSPADFVSVTGFSGKFDEDKGDRSPDPGSTPTVSTSSTPQSSPPARPTQPARSPSKPTKDRKKVDSKSVIDSLNNKLKITIKKPKSDIKMPTPSSEAKSGDN